MLTVIADWSTLQLCIRSFSHTCTYAPKFSLLLRCMKNRQLQAKMEKTIISNEMVLPSSPTPRHLQTYKLSMIDQTNEAAPIFLAFYFANTTNTTSNGASEVVSRKIDEELLKSSLSLTLTRFYPLAGRASADYQSIDCSDQGVPFLVVSINGNQLSDLLKPNADPFLFNQIFPGSLTSSWGAGGNIVMVQVTRFKCGGVSLGFMFLHRVVDATTIATFLKYWAATVRGVESGPAPDYAIPSLFPQKEELRNSAGRTAEFVDEDKYVIRRYVFDGTAIRRLKAEASSAAVESPTRFQVAVALMWKGFMVASLANHRKASALVYVVNLRRRARPPLSSECFGNMIDLTVASYDYNNIGNYDDVHDHLRHLVKEIRDGTDKIDEEYVNRMRGDQGYSGLCENRKLLWSGISEGTDLLFVSSWSGMGFYDVDFGQGKPVWMTMFIATEFSCPLRNTIMLMDTKLGDGVEAWVILKEKYMKVFENVEELKKHASVSSL